MENGSTSERIFQWLFYCSFDSILMSDAFLITIIVITASVTWLTIQTVTWIIFIRSIDSFICVQKLLIAALFGFSVFVFLIALLLRLPAGLDIVEPIITSLVTAGVIFLSWLGLRITARLKHLSRPRETPQVKQ